MENNISSDLQELAVTRKRLEDAKSKIKEGQDLFNQLNKPLFDIADGYKQAIEVLTARIKTTALALYDENPDVKQIVPGAVSIKVFKTLIYSQQDAIEWAEQNAPVFIKKMVDAPAFEKYCGTLPTLLDFVEINEMPQAQIASNLQVATND
jgi:hypothetical protein